MEKFIINGGFKLNGSININGAKNAAVAIIPATLLATGPCVINNLPNISDVSICFKILKQIETSLILGKLLITHGPVASNVAGIIATAAFLAPFIFIEPFNLNPPFIINFSKIYILHEPIY